MAMAEPDKLVEVLQEIRDELRAVRAELATRGARMTTSGIRTEAADRRGRWRNAALAAGGLAGLALVLALAIRDPPAPPLVAVAPRASATPAAKPAMPAMPTGTVVPAQAPVVLAAPVAVPVATPAKRTAVAPTPKRNVAAKPPAEIASDEDETMLFPPPSRRVRVHRLSYGPVESEPAKL
jgi:hypothetical protein